MSITDRTRKLLWGRSGSRCAWCRAGLIAEATPQDRESVVGEECHIVSPKPGGPRHTPEVPANQIDAYPNLILLCAVHHKLVDGQSEEFTADILRQLKEKHELWVRDSLDTASSDLGPFSSHAQAVAFDKVKSTMPDLLSEMESDLRSEGHEFTRQFFLLSKRWVLPYRTPHFRYYEEHDDLGGKLQILESHGFVTDMTTGRAKMYRMTEEFVELLLGEA